MLCPYVCLVRPTACWGHMMAGIPGCFEPDVISNTGFQEVGEKHMRIHTHTHTHLPAGTAVCLYASDTLQNQKHRCCINWQIKLMHLRVTKFVWTSLTVYVKTENRKKYTFRINGVKSVVEEQTTIYLMYIASFKGIVFPHFWQHLWKNICQSTPNAATISTETDLRKKTVYQQGQTTTLTFLLI